MDLIDRSKLHSINVVEGIDSEGIIISRSYWAADVANAPTIDAIPIEWIKKWKERAADGSLCRGPFDLFDNYEYEEAIGRLLSDWEEQNNERN